MKGGNYNMKKRKLIAAIISIALSVAMAVPALAATDGSWTHASPTGLIKDDTWYFLKGNMKYMRNDWVQDTDNTWYYINASAELPKVAGVTKDGYLYNSKGVYVDMKDNRRFATPELFDQVQNGMTYDDVVAILGKEHETVGTGTDNSVKYAWYNKDASSIFTVQFNDGQAADKQVSTLQ
jgi:hypothetical protein